MLKGGPIHLGSFHVCPFGSFRCSAGNVGCWQCTNLVISRLIPLWKQQVGKFLRLVSERAIRDSHARDLEDGDHQEFILRGSSWAQHRGGAGRDHLEKASFVHFQDREKESLMGKWMVSTPGRKRCWFIGVANWEQGPCGVFRGLLNLRGSTVWSLK